MGDDLRNIGITKYGPRKKILNSIASLEHQGEKDLEAIPSCTSISSTDAQPSAPPIPKEQSDSLPVHPPTYSEAIGLDKEIKQIEFMILGIDEAISSGWRLASISDVTKYQKQARERMSHHPWFICKLIDGRIHCKHRGYEVVRDQTVQQGLGHKMVISDDLEKLFVKWTTDDARDGGE